MPKLTVYECPFTKQIFHDKAKYAKHLQKQREILRQGRERKRVASCWADSLVSAGQEIGNLDSLAEWFIKNQDGLYLMGDSFGGKITRDASRPIIVKLAFNAFSYHALASNSHSCPKKGKKNWHRSPDLPRGYPGINGGITIWTVKGDFGGWVHDALNESSICTGSGGGGGLTGNNPPISRYRYDCTVWLDEWPMLGEGFTFAKLNGKTSFTMNGEYYVPEYFS